MITPVESKIENLPKLTNRAALPEAIVNAVKNDGYSKGDANISITGLLKPPRMAALEALHSHEIVEDVSNRIWSLLGQSVHTILERANRTAIAERRLSMEIEGWKVSGAMDLYQEEDILSDFKITSVHKIVQGDLDDWSSQLNCYSALLRHHGHAVNKLQVIAILRDWSKLEAKRNKDYPQAQVVNIPIPLWDEDKALAFIRERVILHQQARLSLPECSPQERWQKPDVWAVMKVNRKSAVKLFSSREEAMAFASTSKDYSVVHRPGISTRCEAFCRVSKLCTQSLTLTQTQNNYGEK
jgi:hypothetical protein